MKKYLHCFRIWLIPLISLCLFASTARAQPATVSYPFAVGRTSTCGSSGTAQMHFYTYNGTTNTITSITGTTGPVGRYTPQLRIGTSGSSGQRFTSSIASVSFSPKDKNIYYLWTDLTNAVAPGGPRTYVWRWPVGSYPTGTAPRLDTIRSFAADILGVAFDASGNGYIIEFTNALPTTPPTYKSLIRSIDFATGALGAADTLALTGGAKIYQTGSGDVAMSPSGQMFFVLDNKLFTPNYQGYTGTGANLTCTYIDTVINSATGNFVGLTYAEGETVSAYSGGGCPFYETDPLTAATTNITKSGTVYSASDLATVISGIGAAKNLVSLTPTGTPNQYNVVYDVYIKNYGNTDITNVQVTDDLTAINGAANVSNVTTSFISNPAGLVLNASFNGNSNINLLNGLGTLPNYPVANNYAVIRISCRLSNILNGTVYNNSAVATAVGYNTQPLRDVSTNGTDPDLNTNDKPDDVGEAQPTPLLIAIAAQTPPCATLGQVFYSQDFGTGANAAALPVSPFPSGRTTYTGSTIQPLAIDQFMLANNANAGDNARFISLTDKTGGGRMLLVNADAANKIFYSDTLTSLCANQQYSLSFYAAFVGNASYQTICNGFGGFQYPKIKMRVRDLATGLIITEVSTTDITLTSWNQYGMKWPMPSGYTDIIFELINDGQGGCGNDIAIDDIALGICDALPTVTVSGSSVGCLGGSTTMSAALNDPNVIPGTKDYQWQISTDNIIWTDIALATAVGYTINPVTAGDVNKYYRVIVAATGNMGSPNCRYTSPGFLLTAKNPSTAPTGATRSVNNICPGDAVTLTVQGGSLGDGGVWRWYTGSCGGTLIGTGASIIVNPLVTTIYYVRAEGDCNATSCATVTVTINCDIDKDDDGIPDVTEGTADTDGDGIANYLDLDSDNDGIPDVVESFGVDADGDGKIDNYTDTDADGFSQNVDGNNTGNVASGSGLGLIDTDGDGIPNVIDLDSDNDGIPDVLEAYGTDANNDGKVDGYTDTDGDGFSDNVDGDVGNDGVAENAANALLRTGADTNGDGRANSFTYKNPDRDGKPNPYDLDSDGDGITDVLEAGFADVNLNGQIDGSFNARGWSTIVSAMGSLILPNRDGTGRANVYDIDADDDGIPDNIEGLATTNYLLPSLADTDGDGIDDSYDDISGFGGKGINPVNTDGDAYPDYLDFDTDGDGVIDRIEGNDFNFNKLPDDNVTLTGLDADNDGLDDRFDADNLNDKVTSAYMGNGGTFSGPASPGSITVVQKSQPLNSDRDWRAVEYVLNCDFIRFSVSLTKEIVNLNWIAVCKEQVDKYVVERSLDVIHFYSVQTIAGKKLINENESYATTDDVSALTQTKIYYRIKAFGENGKIKYTPTVFVLKGKAIKTLQISPNPIRQYLQMNVYSSAPGEGSFLIIDAKGNTVFKFTELLKKGYNVINYNNTANLSDGNYYLHLQIGEEYFVEKFVKKR